MKVQVQKWGNSLALRIPKCHVSRHRGQFYSWVDVSRHRGQFSIQTQPRILITA